MRRVDSPASSERRANTRRLLGWIIALALISTSGLRGAALELSEGDRAFLREHSAWRMAGASSPPFQWMDDRGRLQGIASEYRSIIEDRLGIRLEPVPAQTWDESLEQLRGKACDVSLLTSDTPARREFLIFTEPLMKLPVVIITQRREDAATDLGKLKGHRVAVARNWPIHETLEREHPEIVVVPRDDVGSALSAVSLGDADAYVGDLASASDAIDRLGVRNLQVAGRTVYEFPFRIGVRKDWPEAVALLNRVIGSITPKEHAEIRRKWISAEMGWPTGRVLMIAVPVAIALVVGTLLLVNQRLAREIAQRKKTEAALRESEERWSFALEGSRNGVWDWNVATNEVHFSKRFKAMLQLADDDAKGHYHAWMSRVHPDDLDLVLDELQRHLRGETDSYEVEHRIIVPDGEARWVLSRGRVVLRDQSGKPLRMVGTHTDITERKLSDLALQTQLEETVRQRTAELERAERGLRQITDNIPGAVYQFVRNPDGTYAFTFCSEGLLAMIGVDSEDAVRDVNKVWEVIEPDDMVELMRRAEISAETLQDYAQDLRINHPNGRSWWIRAAATPQRRPDGSTVWNGNIIDITERKLLEAELEQSKQLADSANRAKSVFLANMSHEIRTPLNAILGFSQLLMRDAGLTESQLRHLDTINRSGEHLLALINDVLEISKIEAGRVGLQVDNCDMQGLLQAVEGMFRVRVASKGLVLAIETDESLPQFVKVDEGKLRQVLINLIGNAVKFTEWGGVALRMKAERRGGKMLRIVGEVEDTGPGIPESELPLLFRQFEQTETGRRAGVGTGLGLAISREFIRLMGGDIVVTSKLGQGTTFRFELNAEEGVEFTKGRLGNGRVTRLRPQFIGTRVLIADDKAENRELLERILGPVGFETRAVEDGAQAIATFTEWKPRIGLFDLRMPGVDGYEAIRRIREMPGGSDFAIIAVTASAFEENRREVIAAGGNDFLGKPFREEHLFAKIARLTGIDYEYEEAEATAEAAPAPALTVEAIAKVIPEPLRNRLASAALRADYDEMLAILSEASAHSPEMAEELRKRVERFEYQVLIELAGTESLTT